ncbi:thiamine phosphate synthase [Porticoccus sp. W117]|uniref:thiamine phosphate synthase n=1 Tax=Porticoccus sp. W117 TaxID=3054777 RepID=UPI002598BFF0|nr:thiamine phosphate synthase [Porticoccus sp. W117]MDM3872421.1 thiamine phosphate synthase [Porticoccus sp. W117]
MTKPIVWTVAGSDSGGGAGIQADLHTFESLGVHGCSVITAVTAQNSRQVNGIEAVSSSMLESQLQALTDDLPPAVIKIGLLANPQQVTVVAKWLQQLRGQIPALTVIYDPVAAASTGAALTSEPIADAIKTQLLPQLDVITPNAVEAEQLTSIAIRDYNSLKNAAQVLQSMGVASVVIKGGHSNLIPGRCVDYLRSHLFESGAGEMVLAQPQLDSPHSHGSGCCFASAIAAVWAQGYSLEDAVLLANTYVHRGIRNGAALGRGPGPMTHGPWPEEADDFPQVVLQGSSQANQLGWHTQNQFPIGFATCNTQQLGLYPVVDSCEWLERLLQAGVNTLQLRVKNLPDVELKQQVQQAIELGRQHNARLFINDYWQLAIELGAYGVHLGQEDMESADLSAIQAAGLRLGLSTHGYYELLRALAVKPSYVACGAIYPTTTKTMPSRPQGLNKLRRYLKLTGDVPVVAIGGINLERAPAVAATGVGSIAVVTAITEAADYALAVSNLQSALEG